MILISRRLEYNLLAKLDWVKPESQQILLEYLDEHKWELEYQQAITNDDSSCLAFVQYATKQMRESCRYMMNWKNYRKEVEALTQ